MCAGHQKWLDGSDFGGSGDRPRGFERVVTIGGSQVLAKNS